MGRTRALRATRLSLVGKVGGRLHLSKRKAIDAYLPFLERLFRGAPSTETGPGLLAARRAVARELRLSPEELAFLLGSEPEGAAVRSLVAGETPREEEEAAETSGSDDPTPSAAASPTRPAPPGGGSEKRGKVQRKLAEF
jgi:hypothetical protein